MSSRFYFGGGTSSSNNTSPSDSEDDDDTATLPFPKPVDRSAFLSANFDPATFLSNLSSTNRFQTLEDLQTELRELSAALNKELVDLVNDNYQDFLTLGATLQGGEERIEEIRVGLLGFERDVQGVREAIETKRREVQESIAEKRRLRKEVNVGRALLELAERLDALEAKMGLAAAAAATTKPTAEPQKKDNKVATEGETWSNEWNEDVGIDSGEEDDDEENESNTSTSTGLPPRLRRRVDEFLIVTLLASRHSPQHPFLVAEQSRIRRLREILLLDIDASIKAEPDVKVKQKIMQLRRSVDE